MRRSILRGGLRALGSATVVALISSGSIARAAWPALEVPLVDVPASVSGDGSTVVGLGVIGPVWRRGTNSVTTIPSFLLWDTAYDGSFYPPAWTPHPSWEGTGSPAQPWPVQFLPTGLSGDRSTYYGTYFDGPVESKSTPVYAARYSTASGLETFGAVIPNFLANVELPLYLATGSSADGAVIVGNHPVGGKSYGFRWTQDEGPTNVVQGAVSNVSADGNTIIGFTSDNALFKWTADEGVVVLGTGAAPLVGWLSGGVSADGSRIVATDLFWSAPTGTRNLFDVLVNWYGLDPAGRTQFFAADISDNGRVIVGESDLGSFVVELPAPGDADGNDIVDGADYTSWADHFLSTSSNWQTGDFTGDAITDGADYTVWADNYQPQEAAPLVTAATVPEPASLVTALIGAICGAGFIADARARRRSSTNIR